MSAPGTHENEWLATPGSPYQWWLVCRRWCDQRGLPMMELARRAGVDRGAMSRWRTQTRTPTTQTVERVARVMGMHTTRALQLCGLIPSPAHPTNVRRAVELSAYPADVKEALLAAVALADEVTAVRRSAADVA